MTLTPRQQQQLRNKILKDIDADAICEIDQRFQETIFGSHENMVNWCSKWNLIYRYVSYPGITRKLDGNKLIQWIQFLHAHDHRDEFFIFPDKRLDERQMLIICSDESL
jgi:hypothetical protein